MDSNEEFEFKPLTEGLGFHSKKIDLASEVKKSKLVSEMVSNKIAKEVQPMPSVAFEESKINSEKIIKSPLPRPEASQNKKAPDKDVIDELIESFKKPAKSFVEEKKADVIFDKIPTEAKINGIKTAWALAPFLVDLMMVSAFFLIGLIISLYVTKVDIIDFTMNSLKTTENIMVLPAILLMMVFMYVILTRIFIGGTLGEMVFDMQLGTSKDQRSASYGFKVLARLILVMITGFATLPLLSWIFRTDISGKILRLPLVKKK
jgi:hypothetical protein